MENLNNQLCSNCYMFYGAKETNSMCSKCFREINSTKTNKITENNEKIVTNDIVIQKEESNQIQEEVETKVVNKSKCNFCNKKLGLLGMECSCKFYFCKKHRLPESHNCCYDFKKKAMEDISKNNPKMIEKKLNGF